MSYDIELIDKYTGKTAIMTKSEFIRGGTVPAIIEPATLKLVQVPQTEAHINITYNYSKYYYEALNNKSEEENKGIRIVYGMKAIDSIPILMKMINNIREKYENEDGTWTTTKRKSKKFFDKNGHEIKDLTLAILNKAQYTEVEYEYEVNEGDKTDYWTATAANAIDPLNTMIYMAIQCPDAIWDGD